MLRNQSNILKMALFATGLSGIVAEYVLATLATYFLGDSVFQWTIVVSLMMFAMGLGSRFSRQMSDDLLEKFIYTEFTLSVVVSFAPGLVYFSSAFIPNLSFLIYFLTIVIGFLVGMEIPLVIRINDQFETLRTNISSAMENDYYGSLLGGLFFAFIGLPYLGITYTPFLLGAINLCVALLLISSFQAHRISRYIMYSGAGILLFIIAGAVTAPRVVLFGEQAKYRDKIIFSQQSQYQKVIISEWKGNYWLYINGNLQFCSLDEVMYHEPLVHPAMLLHPYPQKVMVFGGGDGCAVREILKHPSVDSVTVVDLDPLMTNLGKEHSILTDINDSSFHSPRVKIINQDAFTFIEQTMQFADVIIIDLPDPKVHELSRLYSKEFYMLCRRMLRPHGVIVTQAGSPYFATKAFICIQKTMQAAGFCTVPIHNQVLTMGEWGWVIGSIDSISKESIQNIKLNIPTKWLDSQALQLISSFGKGVYIGADTANVKVNTVNEPYLQKYYLQGNWSLY